MQYRLGREVKLANDANCFALSEAIDGAGKESMVVFGAILGTGCGGSIVVNRQVLVGPNAICGEWGHNPLPGYHLEQDGQHGTVIVVDRIVLRDLFQEVVFRIATKL